MTEQFLHFPSNFTWGTATASYQIEGSWNVDGRGLSIWDTFSHTPGNVAHGHTGDTAADHYKRWEEDLGIISLLGTIAYRFSIAWPRIQPSGVGAANPAGLDFYDRLVDGLLERNIRPFVTLYHWDLPQALQDMGGWAERDTANRFADYAQLVVERLGDRVSDWITHNEPWVTAMVGHLEGRHAPGIQDIAIALRVVHNLLLSHGLAVKAIRSSAASIPRVGITLNLSSIESASQSDVDLAAARRVDGINNRLFLDPVLNGQYPQDLMAIPFLPFPSILTDDMETISAPIDFLGINYYHRTIIANDDQNYLLGFRQVLPEESEYSQMWEIYPDGLHDLLFRLNRDYKLPDTYITENGICVPDGIDFDGKIRDYRRIRYLRDHLTAAHRAITKGVPLKGYFVWSLLDNFEWAFGYDMRFGIVYVDFETLERKIKESGYWYSQVVRQNGFNPMGGVPC